MKSTKKRQEKPRPPSKIPMTDDDSVSKKEEGEPSEGKFEEVISLLKVLVMKPAQEKIEKIDQRLRIQPLRVGNILYIT